MTGTELRQHRQAMGMLQAQFAELLGRSARQVSRWEHSPKELNVPWLALAVWRIELDYLEPPATEDEARNYHENVMT